MQQVKWWCVVAALWGGCATAAVPAVCKDCVRAQSTVKGAAGEDPKVRLQWQRAVRGLHFEGDGLVAGAPVAEVAAPFVARAERGTLRLAVRADPGLAKAAASAQAKARAGALKNALIGAGLAASRVRVTVNLP